MSDLEDPTPALVRAKIERCPDREMRLCLKAGYLFCGRISEVVGVSTLRDSSSARGPKGTDADRELYVLGQLQEPAIVFSVKTAKKGGMLRRIGLPPAYEPWAQEVFDYFRERGEELAFPFTRQTVSDFLVDNDVFGDLTYTIEDYKIWENKIMIAERHKHPRPFRFHAMRHIRAGELVGDFGFDGVDLAIHGGWSLERSMMSAMTKTMARYAAATVYRNWSKPFPKLLKRSVSSEDTRYPSATSPV